MILKSVLNTLLSIVISVTLLLTGAYLLDVNVPGEVVADMVVAGICLIPLLVVINYLSIAQNRAASVLHDAAANSTQADAAVVVEIDTVEEKAPSALKNGWRRRA